MAAAAARASRSCGHPRARAPGLEVWLDTERTGAQAQGRTGVADAITGIDALCPAAEARPTRWRPAAETHAAVGAIVQRPASLGQIS